MSNVHQTHILPKLVHIKVSTSICHNMIHKTQVQHAPHDDLPFLSRSLIVSLIVLAVKPKHSFSVCSFFAVSLGI